MGTRNTIKGFFKEFLHYDDAKKGSGANNQYPTKQSDTFQAQQAAEASGISQFAPISELWDQAYDSLEKEESNSELMVAYRKELRETLGEDVSKEKGRRREQMEKVVDLKMQEVQASGKSKKSEAVIKYVVACVESSKDSVGSAVQFSLPASTAWAGVCLLLPLFLNAPEQKASRLAGLEEITGIIRDCSILENLYRKHYETDDGQQLQEAATTSNNAFRNSMMALYTSVLKFQVTIMTYHSRKKLQRLVDDVAKWTDWNGLIDEIRAAYKRLDSIAKRWITSVEQEDREELKRSLEQRFQHLVANQNRLLDIQRDRDRSLHLKWLHSVGENVSASGFQNNLSGHRGKLETGEWLLADPKFKKWEKGLNQFLWLYGKAGTGKSILSSKVIDHFEGSSSKYPDLAVAYFYISFQYPKTQKKANLTASLIVQLLSKCPRTPQFVVDLYDQYHVDGLPHSKLENALRLASQEFNNVYIVIDGLDECRTLAAPLNIHTGELDAQQEVLEFINTIHEWRLNNLHLLLTSRPEQGIKEALSNILQTSEADLIDLATHEYSEQINQDIMAFLKDQLRKKRIDGPRRDLIMENLTRKADGMFLYVALQLGQFTAQQSIGDLEDKLKLLPPRLDSVYERVLVSLSDTQQTEQRNAVRALTWVAFSPTPLTFAQLAEAVLIDLESQDNMAWIEDSDIPREGSLVPLIDDNYRLEPGQVLGIVPGLLDSRRKIIDDWGSEILQAPDLSQTGSVVVLSHVLVLEYLASIHIGERLDAFALDEETARIKLAKACLRYHSYVSAQMAQGNRTEEEFPLIHQAYIFGLRHAEILGRQKWPSSLRYLIKSMFWKGRKEFDQLRRLESPLRETAPKSPLLYSIGSELWETTLFLIADDTELDIHSTDSEFGRTPLSWACTKGKAEIVELLLKKGSHPDSRSKNGRTPLSLAAENGHDAVVRILINARAEVDPSSTAGQTPLCWAAAKGHLGIVNTLLNLGAHPDSEDDEGKTPLSWAVVNGHRDVVDLLIKINRVNVNSKDRYDQTPLSWAAANGHEDIVMLLLERRDIKVKTRDRHGRTPLSLAAENGNASIINLLLTAAKNELSWSQQELAMALSWAAGNGRDAVVERLLNEDIALLNTQDTQYRRTPLAWAAAHGYTPIVERLLKFTDVNIHLRDKYGQTPLSLATANQHTEVINLLLEAGKMADRNVSESKQTVALFDQKQEAGQVCSCEQLDIPLPLHEASSCTPETRLISSVDPRIVSEEEHHQRPKSPAKCGTDTTGISTVTESDSMSLASSLRACALRGIEANGEGIVLSRKVPTTTRFWPVKLLQQILTRDRVLNELRGYADLPNAETYIALIRPEENVLGGSVSPGYLRIFALLLLLDRGSQIGEFVKGNLSDQSLPVRDLQSLPPAPFRTWEDTELKLFDTWQWEFLTPYFELDQSHQPKPLTLDDKTVLPFCQVMGASSMGGSRLKMHQTSHGFQEVLKPILLIDEDFSFIELHLCQRRDIRICADGVVHNHLVPLLGIYTFQQRNYLLTPWAKTDLETYWEYENPNPELTMETIQWFYEQCSGIMAAIDAIHNPADLDPMRQWSRFHGAIQPDNILLFESSDNSKRVLVLAKLLQRVDRERSRAYIPNFRILESRSYVAPEAFINDNSFSRTSDDIFAIGCVFLEMVTWLLGGWELLLEFQRQRVSKEELSRSELRGFPSLDPRAFFELKRVDDSHSRHSRLARVKPQVEKWFLKLRSHDICSQLIHDTLDIIERQMIVTSLKTRGESAKLSSLFRNYSNRANTGDWEYCIKGVPRPEVI